MSRLFSLGDEDGGADADEKDCEDKYERSDRVYREEFVDEHLNSDKYKQNADAYFQVAEFVSYGRQEEEQCPQSKYRKYIREEYDIRVESHRKDCRNAVKREYQVAEFDKYNSYNQWAQAKILVKKLDHGMVQRIHRLFLVAVQKHLDTAIQQERTEYQKYPVKTPDKCSPGEYEQKAQHNCAQNTPVEGVLIIFLINSERGEYHHHHEKDCPQTESFR